MLTWLSENLWVAWLLAALVLALLEVFLLEFFCLMMAGGALAAAASAAFTDHLVIQVLVFAAVSFLLLLAVRPSLVRRLYRDTPETLTNTDRLIGQVTEVLEPVDADQGLVRLAGGDWTARSATGHVLEAGTRPVVVRIEGATAVVALQ